MTEPHPTGWVRCPRGELQQLAGRLRQRRRQHSFVQAAAGVLAGAIVVGALTLAGTVVAQQVINYAFPATPSECSPDEPAERCSGSSCQ